MTKISTYVVDEKVTALDKWIGSDANMQNRTKNFTPKKLAAYFNEDQVINIGTPLQYKYYTLDPLEARPNGTLTFETEIGPTVNFSSITTFLLSKYTTKQNIVSDFLNFLDGSKVLLFKSSDINSFGFYRISSLEPYEPDPNFFIVTVAYETGNGALEEDEDYMISLVSLAGDFIPTKTSELINDGDDGVNPFISELDINRTEWDEAYDGKINSAEVTGTTTKTLTLTKQDGGTIEASWTDSDTGLTSVGVSMPTAFSVANSPLTSNGTINITGAGTSLEYIKGDGTLGVFPTLTGYIPYTGATQDVDLGTHQLKANSLAVSTTSTETVDVGEIVWNSVDGTFDMGLIGGVTLQAGQELHMYGKATEAISNGQVVMFAGVQGNHILIAKADAATINANPEYLIGVATQDFVNNQFGYVTVFGNVRGLNTTGYTLGSVLYYNSESSTDGLLTATMPTAPNAKIIVAAVVRVHATQGILLVRPHTMPKLKDVQDVYAPSPSSNNGLFWNSSTLRYENNSIIGALGYTPYNATNPSNYITLGSISSTATGLTYTNTTGVFSLTGGYVIPTTTEESNWNDAYSNRITSASTPLSISSNAISISQAGSSTNGYLTSADWNTFNSKQVAGNYITSLTGEATASGPGASSVTLNNASITAKILSGVNITGGTILDTDTMLTAFGKLQNQINSLIGGSIYQGVWNASTNTPTLISSVGTDGNYYIVNVAGSTNLNGITDWKIGDWAIFHGGTWQKVDNTDAVSSVNGQTGAVSLTTDNISEGTTNLYFTNARVSANTDVAANTASRHSPVYIGVTGTINGLSIDSSQTLTLISASSTQSGALSSTDWNKFNNNIPAGTPNVGDYVIYNGSNLSYRTVLTTSPLSFNVSTGTFAISQATTSANGYLSSTDWNTFNGKQNALTNPITGTGTTNYLSKFTGSGYAIGNSLIFDNGTNVGIGTTSPRTPLEVFGNGLILSYSTSNAAARDYLIATNYNAFGDFVINQANANGGNPYSAGTTRFTINAGGNVGIGTTSPGAKLDVVGGGIRWGNGTIIGEMGYSSRAEFGTISNHDLGFTSNGTTQMILKTSGNVGIGTTSPSAKLTILGSNSIGSSIPTNWAAISSGRFGMVNGNNSFYFDLNPAPYAELSTYNYSSGATFPLVLQGNGGNVGIGTTSPAEKLDVSGNIKFGDGSYNSTLNQAGIAKITSTFTDQSNVQFYGHTGGASNNLIMTLRGGGNVGIGTTSPASRLHLLQSSNTALTIQGDASEGNTFINFSAESSNLTKAQIQGARDSALGGRILIHTTNSSGTLVERLRINESGNVGIGTTSPSYQLQLSTDSAAKPTSALWTIASDERIKENINSYTKGLNELLKINPITYDYNGLGGFKKGKGGVGIIAQEIAEILPDSVSSIKGKLNETDEEEIDILNFNGHELTYILINAVKELKAEIEILKNK